MRTRGPGSPNAPVAPQKESASRPLEPENPFRNGKADEFNFKDAKLAAQLKELQGDSATVERLLPKLDPKVVIVGSARSRPVPGENGHEDYVWAERLGEELRKAGFSIGSGGGPGAMEAPLRGHARMEAFLESVARTDRPLHGPERGGANIVLPEEQAANPFIDTGRLATFQRFLFRMEFLFRNTRDLIVTTGGFGSVAELFTYLAMKAHGQVGDPVLFGAHDNFFETFNAAFEPLLSKPERADFKNIYRDPKKLVAALRRAGTDGVTDDIPALISRMRDDLELGLSRLDGKPPAFAFVGGAGPRSRAAATAMAKIAEVLAQEGETLRVAGSPLLDKEVLSAARRARPDAEVEAFGLSNAPLDGTPGLDYTKVDNLLVLTELMSTNVKGMVVSPEGAQQIALLFTTATDIQTRKTARIPIVVLDPDHKFEALKEELRRLMLSKRRRYIDPEDLDLFTVTNSPAEALRVLNSAQRPR